MACKVLSIPKSSRISRLVFFYAFCGLTWISSVKDESSRSVTFCISMFVDNSCLSLVAVSEDSANAG